MSAGYRSLLGFWLGGLSAARSVVSPVIASIVIYPAVAGAVAMVDALRLRGMDVSSAIGDASAGIAGALEGAATIDPAVAGTVRRRT